MNGPVRTIEERDGAWLRIVLDRPPGNLLSVEMVRGIGDALRTGRPGGRKWVTLEGAGTEFSFGAMIQEHLPGTMEQVLLETHQLLERLLEAPCPTAALVHGRCLGGAFELALACDVVIAAESAVLGLPEIALAAFPPAAAALLPLRAGASRAAEAMLTGARRSAADWQASGVVGCVVPDAGLHRAASEWFDNHLSPRSRAALGVAAAASRLVVRQVAGPALAAAHHLYVDRVLTSEDAVEGVRAFVEKRTPRWSDG